MATEPDKEHQLILRLPQDHTDRVLEAMNSEALEDRLQVEFVRDALGEMRQTRVKFDEEILEGKLVDLPCIVESYKTLDGKTLYKTGDISQMLVCATDIDQLDLPTTDGESLDEMTASKRKELSKKFVWNHGLTPPLKNVRKKRFRKTKTKKTIESPEVESEIRRLLREDNAAVSVSFRVIDEEKQIDDTQSVISDTTSRAQTPGMAQDEDSLMSMPSSLGQSTDDKSELFKMFEEVSCSSSSEDSEEEEISVVDESPESEEVSALRAAVEDLDTQIEEQRLKIQNTPNKMLRTRFESFLMELEKQRQSKVEELVRLRR